MELRIGAIIVILVLAGAAPFAATPTSNERAAAVPFEETKQTGLSGTTVRQVQNSTLVVPKAEAYYSQYQYVVGYYGVTTLVAGLKTHQQREFGRLLTLYVSDFSGTSVNVTEDGYLRMPLSESTGWVPAQEAFFVVNSSAHVPPQRTAIVPFSNESDAHSFARQYGGSVQQWEEVRKSSRGQAGRSTRAWQQTAQRRQAQTDRTVSNIRTSLNRSVSTVVGRDAPTLEAAIERAPPNTTVVVPPGTYQVDDLRIRKPLTLRGAGANATHIVGNRNGSVITVSAPKTAIRRLSITGVGSNRSGNNRTVKNVPVPKQSWKYRYYKTHGYGDAAIVFDSAGQSSVSAVQINTTSNGIISRRSPNLTVSNLTLYGTKRWENGFVGVVALNSDVVVQDSQFYGGKIGVFTFDTSRIVIRDTSMEGMMVGVLDLYASQLLITNNTIDDTWIGVYIETRSSENIMVDNRLHNNFNGIVVEGRENYFAHNVMVHNYHGILVRGQYSVYRHNLLAYNQIGARGMTLFPTNRVTANDFVGNQKYVQTIKYNILHVWPGNYWQDAPGLQKDGEKYLSRTFRPTGPVDGLMTRATSAATLARSPALQLLRQLQQLLPGLRSNGVVDPTPLAQPVHPQLVQEAQQNYNRTGEHEDADPWDYVHN
ncbi:copper-binding protein [halophilic archaeon]|nr:copper-binding protein [halophilic archaeon]